MPLEVLLLPLQKRRQHAGVSKDGVGMAAPLSFYIVIVGLVPTIFRWQVPLVDFMLATPDYRDDAR